MKMRLFAPIAMHETKVSIPESTLSQMSCGLFRAPLTQVNELMPELSALWESVPTICAKNPHEWEVDVKIHMLMPNQYPCVPNWHSDNVPRIGGDPDYRSVPRDMPPMFLWVSGNPTTVFMRNDKEFEFPATAPITHASISEKMHELPPEELLSIDAQRWYAMCQKTPHRGSMSNAHQWRIFVRLTHKSIAPDRPVHNYIRRHCQVYLDAHRFSW